MFPVHDVDTEVTTDEDPRITKSGRLWRKTKIDKLPKLINALKSEMSFVGPRPDVPGFTEMLVEGTPYNTLRPSGDHRLCNPRVPR